VRNILPHTLDVGESNYLPMTFLTAMDGGNADIAGAIYLPDPTVS
tara:strand:+ start:1591 stop:1725 length:135 start_codon:yes stop_codon:yes gene_type:complete